jgi:UDPglucose 6-dehydrogenase
MIKNPTISFLVPSRERAEALKFSLDSLGLKRNKIEALVWVDEDDPQLKEYKKLFGKNNYVRLFIKPRVGYLNSHLMINFLASRARGNWLVLWNDDAYMENVKWYDTFKKEAKLASPLEEPVVYNIWGQGKAQNLFPVISRKYFEIVGHFSESTICDTWVKHVACRTNIQRTIFGIKPHHRKFGHDDGGLGDLIDKTHKAVQHLAVETGDVFLGQKSPERLERMEKDVFKINNWIRNNSNRDVGFIGLGKLGLPVALAIESKGKNIVAFDINPDINQYIKERKIPFQEQGVEKLLQTTKIEMVDSIEHVVKKCNLVFCAIQTPHDPRFEGDKPLKEEPVDFDYSYLKKAIKDIVEAANKLDEKTTLVVISTCLPGTYEKEIKPLLTPKINYVYNPFFIAMGTVIDDFLNPDFVLVGNNRNDITPLTNFYKMIFGADKAFVTDITTAEGIKVLYNSYLTLKIVFANTYGEMAHKLGMNADDIYKAFSLATNRILSPRYLKAGVGTGGGCHPRDNIALSYLAKKHKMSFNIFEHLMDAREKHMEWLAKLAKSESKSSKLPIVILGKAFKPESNLQTGSPAILLANILKGMGVRFSHWEFDHPKKLPVAVYILATQHAQYAEIEFPKGSIVIDPFRYISKKDGIRIVSIGGKI